MRKFGSNFDFTIIGDANNKLVSPLHHTSPANHSKRCSRFAGLYARFADGEKVSESILTPFIPRKGRCRFAGQGFEMGQTCGSSRSRRTYCRISDTAEASTEDSRATFTRKCGIAI